MNANTLSVVPSTLEAFILTSIGEPLPQDLHDRGYHILETLQDLPIEQQVNLACRTLLAMVLLRRPSPGAPQGAAAVGCATVVQGVGFVIGFDAVALGFFLGWTVLAGWLIFLGGAEWAEDSGLGDFVLRASFGVSADAPVTVIKVWVAIVLCGALVLVILW